MTSHLTVRRVKEKKMPNKWLTLLICRMEKVQIERFKCQVGWKMLNKPEKPLLDDRRTYRDQCMGSGTMIDEVIESQVIPDTIQTHHIWQTQRLPQWVDDPHMLARRFWFTSAFVMLILAMDFSPKTLSPISGFWRARWWISSESCAKLNPELALRS